MGRQSARQARAGTRDRANHSAHRRARRDRPAAGVAPGRPGDGCDAGGHRHQRRGAQRGHAPARRRHSSRAAGQLPARIDFSLRRRDSRLERAHHRGPSPRRSWSTAWPTASGRERFCRSRGFRTPTIRPPRRATGSRARFVGRLAASSGRATRCGWLFRSIRRATEETATRFPRPLGLRGPGVGTPGGRSPGAVHCRLVEGPGHRPAGRPDRAGWKHKSRLSKARRDRWP